MSSLIRRAANWAGGARDTPVAVAVIAVLVLAAPCILVVVILGWVLWPLEWTAARANKALRGVGRQLDDPVFGPVAYQGYSLWHADLNLDALGGRLVVEVPGARAIGPSRQYVDLFRGLSEHQHEIARQAEDSIFREYQAAAPELRRQFVVGTDRLSESFRRSVPNLDRPAQIWALLSDGTITFDEDHLERPGSFSISWQCTWGVEFGDVYRTFVNWELEAAADG